MHRTAKEIKMMNEQCPHIVGMSTCPECDEARITELEQSLLTISTALDAYGVEYCRVIAANALKEKADD